jgi:hypothetical protein
MFFINDSIKGDFSPSLLPVAKASVWIKPNIKLKHKMIDNK